MVEEQNLAADLEAKRNPEHQQHRYLHILVQTPRGLWSLTEPENAPRRPVYALNSKIQQLINDVREVFGFVENGNQYVLLHGDDRLQPERTIESYHLKDGTLLVLSVQGGNAV
jgi:hypothetical protein